MAVNPRLMMGAGIAIAGLGLIGAGAGATFTTQVSGSQEITTGDLGLSLNGKTGSDLHLGLDGENLGSHFMPISKTLVLKNTGTLDMASTYLSVTATGCDKGKGKGAALAKALHVRLTEVTTQDDKLIFDGDLCALASDQTLTSAKSGQGFITPPDRVDVGGQLPHALQAGKSVEYLLVIQPDNASRGLPTKAQSTSTTVNLVFTGFDY